MDAHCSNFFAGPGLFIRLAAAKEQDRHHHNEINIESLRTNFHSDTTKPQHAKKVKTLMGKQLNKAIKRQRREKYIKRKKAVVNAKKATKAKPAKAGA
jgi:hypothetical protein